MQNCWHPWLKLPFKVSHMLPPIRIRIYTNAPDIIAQPCESPWNWGFMGISLVYCCLKRLDWYPGRHVYRYQKRRSHQNRMAPWLF